jgi:hypothetical protein
LKRLKKMVLYDYTGNGLVYVVQNSLLSYFGILVYIK